MYYLVKCPQNPFHAMKRYREFLELCGEGAKLRDLNNHVRQSRLLPNGLPWEVITFGDDSEAGEVGNYLEISPSLFAGEEMLVDRLFDALEKFPVLHDRIQEYLAGQTCFGEIKWVRTIKDIAKEHGIKSEEILEDLVDAKERKSLKLGFEKLSEFFPSLDLNLPIEEIFCTEIQVPEMDDLKTDFHDAKIAIELFVADRIGFLNLILTYLIEHSELREEVSDMQTEILDVLSSIQNQFDIVCYWHKTVLGDEFGDYYIIDSSVAVC